MDPIGALLAHAAAPAPRLEPTDEDAFADPAWGQALTALRRTPALRDPALTQLAAALPGLSDAYQAARVALVCGTVVEWGGDPGRCGPAIVDRLAAEVGAGDGPRWARTVRFLCLAAMATMCRDVAVRRHARTHAGFAGALEATEIREASFVQTVVELVDDLELVVLHLERGEGVRLRLEAVANNFHLLTLLHGTVPAWCADDPLDPEVWAQARGEAPPAAVTDHARFHVALGAAMPAEGAPGIGASLWGEALPDSIPSVGGERVLVASPMLLGGRSWDSGFFPNVHDALHPALTVLDRFDPAEVARRIAALRG
ncbi:MAG: hypothetical protein R3F59_09915 [Myxococcota bacterium]